MASGFRLALVRGEFIIIAIAFRGIRGEFICKALCAPAPPSSLNPGKVGSTGDPSIIPGKTGRPPTPLAIDDMASWASDEYSDVVTVSGDEFVSSLWLGALYLLSLGLAAYLFERVDWHVNRLSSAAASLLGGERCKTWTAP